MTILAKLYTLINTNHLKTLFFISFLFLSFLGTAWYENKIFINILIEEESILNMHNEKLTHQISHKEYINEIYFLLMDITRLIIDLNDNWVRIRYINRYAIPNAVAAAGTPNPADPNAPGNPEAFFNPDVAPEIDNDLPEPMDYVD